LFRCSQTADASIGTTIDSEEIQRLPTIGSDPYELLRTAPGITGDGARSGTGQAVFLPNGAGPGGSNSGIFQTENRFRLPRPASARPTTTSWWTA
jgi:hypothetical protein